MNKMAEHVVFCDTDAYIWPLTSFSQFIIEGNRLVTLIGERHQALCRDGSEPECGIRPPPGSLTVAQYAVRSAMANVGTKVFLEVDDAACSETLAVIGSRPIREASCSLQEYGLWNQAVTYDTRNMFLGEKGRLALYCGKLHSRDDRPMSPQHVAKFVWDKRIQGMPQWWGATMEEMATGFLELGYRENRTIILAGDVLRAGHAILEDLQMEISSRFHSIYDTGFTEYNRKVTNREQLTQAWYMQHIVNPLQAAWALVTDYFAIRDFFTETNRPFNEAILIAGYMHTRNIARYLTGRAGVTRLPGPPDGPVEANTCIPFTGRQRDGTKIYTVATVTPEGCQRIFQEEM